MRTKLCFLLIITNSFFIKESIPQTYTYNIKIAPHIVLNSQGQGIPTSDVDLSIQQVNAVYNTYNNTSIHFIMLNVDYIDNTIYTTGDRVDFAPIGFTHSQELQNLFNERNTIGVLHVFYIKKEYTMGGAGVSENIPGTKIVITNEDATNGETLAHEIGHCFGLLHTYETTKFNIQPDNELASGVYIYKLQAGSFTNSKKMLLLK